MSSLSKIKPMKKPSFVKYQIFFAKPVGSEPYVYPFFPSHNPLPSLPEDSMGGTSPLPVAVPLNPVVGQEPKEPPTSKVQSGTQSPVKKQQ